MDELIYYLIQLLIGLFTDGGKGAKGPGYPTLPPRPPATPPPPGQRRPIPPSQQPQPQIRRKVTPPPKRPVVVTSPQPAPSTLPKVQFSALSVAAPASQAQARAPADRPAQQSTARSGARVNAAVLRRWLQPQTLQNQFMLTEIFQPPLALRAKPLD